MVDHADDITDDYLARHQDSDFNDIIERLDQRFAPSPYEPGIGPPANETPEQQPAEDQGFLKPYSRGLKAMGHGLLRGTQHFWDFMDSAAELVSRATGWEKGELFADLVKMAEPPPDWEPEDLAEKIVSGITAAGPTIATISAMPGSAPVTMGYMGGITGGAKGGVKGAVVEGAKGVLLGNILHGAGALVPGLRVPVMAGVGGVQAFAEGGGAEEIAEGAAVMGTLGLMGGPGQRGRPSARKSSASALETERPSKSTSVTPTPGSLTQEPALQTSATRPPPGGETTRQSSSLKTEYRGYRSGIETPPVTQKITPETELVKRQPFPTVEDNLAQAQIEQPAYQKTLEEIAAAVGARAQSRVKDRARIDEKMVQRNIDPADMTDYLAGRIEDDPLAKKAEIEDMLQKKGYRIIEEENYIEQPNAAGYRAINYLVQSPQGSIMEFQLHFKGALDVVEKSSHPVYEKWRTVQAENNGVIPPDRQQEYETDMAKSQAEWVKAWSEYAKKEPAEQAGQISKEIKTVEKVARGAEINILHGQGRDTGYYAIMDLNDLIPSHSASQGFAVDPRYPKKTQERRYHADQAEQLKVKRNAQMYDPSYTVNTDPTLINGPPAVTRQGVVLGGNSRVMTLDLVYSEQPGRAKSYRDYLKRQADTFGLDPAQVDRFTNPVLVRLIDADLSGKELQKRVRLYNEPPTQAIEAKAEGVSKARLLSDGTMERLAADLEEFSTLREYLGNNKSKQLITDLIRDGALEQRELNKMTSGKTGLLSEDGKRSVEQIIRGRVIDDADLIEQIPPAMLQKLDKSIPALARVKARGEGWDIIEDLKLALGSYSRMKAAGFTRPDEYLAQVNAFEPDPAATNPRVRYLLDAISEKKPLDLKNTFDEYAKSAAADVKDQGTLSFYTPETPAKAFERLFIPETKAAEPQSPYEVLKEQYGEGPQLEEALQLYNQAVQLSLFEQIEKGPGNVRTAAGNLERDTSGISTLANGIRADLSKQGRVNLRGQEVKTAEELATLAQVLRNPQFETLHYFYMKGKKIVAHEAVTSRLPASGAAFVGDMKKACYKMRDRMRRTGADGYYVLHNHPSGLVEPSQLDINLTGTLYERVPGLKAHIIINSGKYLVLQPAPGGKRELIGLTKTLPAAGPERLLRPAIEHPALGKEITNPFDMAGLAKAISRKENQVTLIYRSKNQVRAMQNVPDGIFRERRSATDFIRGQARKFGAQDVFAYYDYHAGKPLNIDINALRLLKENALRDVVTADEGGVFSAQAASGARPMLDKQFGISQGRLPAYKVFEKPGQYNLPLVDVSEKPFELKGEELTGWEKAAELEKEGVVTYKKRTTRTVFPEEGIKTTVGKQRELFPEPGENLDMFAAETPAPYAININLARLRTTDDIRNAILKTSEAYSGRIQEARRGKITREQTELMADELGMTVKDLLTRREGQAFNAEEALAARHILVSSGRKLVDLAQKVQSGQATDIEKLAFRDQLNLHYAIQAQVSGMTAEAGRALSSFNILAESNVANLKDINDLLKTMGGRTTEDLAALVGSLDTPGKINKFVRDSQKARTWDVLLEVYINALLSGPQTHAVNTLSNSLVALWQIPERFIASQIGRALPGEREIVEGEAVAQAYGMAKGIPDAFRMAWQALKTGEPSDPMSKLEARRFRAISSEALELSGNVGRAVDLLGNTIRVPGRLLVTGDEFFKGVGKRMELQAQAYRRAHAEGLTGRDMAERVRDIINNPPEDIQKAVVDAERYQTFTDQLTGLAADVQGAAMKHPALRVIVPFVRTPTNIMKFTFHRTPLAPISKNVRADIRAGGARRDLALARMALGSVLMGTCAVMAAEGKITGAGPKDKDMRNTLYRTGWQPYSFNIAGKYYAYNRLEPLGSIVGIAADMAEIIGQAEDADIEELTTAAVMSVSRNVTSKTFLRGASEFFEVMSNPDRYGSRYLQNLAGSALVPTGVAQYERVQDPVLREVHSIMDKVRSRIPGYSDELPPRRNLWGEPIVLSGGLGPDIMSPIYTSKEIDSPIDKQILEHEIPVNMPSPQIEGIQLTPAEYSRYVEIAGKVAQDPETGLNCKQSLDRLVKSEEYKRQSDGPDGGKSAMVRNMIEGFRDLARSAMLGEFSELRLLVQDRRKMRQRQLEEKY